MLQPSWKDNNDRKGHRSESSAWLLPSAFRPTTRTRIRQRGRKSKGNCNVKKWFQGSSAIEKGAKELTIIAALWFYLSYYDSKTHRRTSACWLAFGPAIYARY